MSREVSSWIKVVGIAVLVAVVALSVPLLIMLYRFHRVYHDLSYAQELQIDVGFINGVQARVLEQFFEGGLSREDLPGDKKRFLEQHADEHDDLYLISRVTPKLGSYRLVTELTIEIVEPAELRGRRYSIVPPGDFVQLTGEVSYSLFKVQSARRPILDVTTPVQYKVVHIYTE